MVGRLGAPQAGQPHIFLQVDVDVLLGDPLHELVADDGVHALEGDITLLDAQVERVAVDGHAIGEGHHFAVDKQSATDGPEPFPIVKYPTDGFPLHHLAVGTLDMAQGLGIVAPLLQQLHAVGKQGGLQRAVFVIGVEARELVQVLPLGAHLLALEGDNLFPQADVVVALGQRL